jgi:DNA-binding MarR family transcriptional regulator
VWGPRETGELAEDCGVAKGTLTGLVGTLEKDALVSRTRHPEDGRKVVVHLQRRGEETI